MYCFIQINNYITQNLLRNRFLKHIADQSTTSGLTPSSGKSKQKQSVISRMSMTRANVLMMMRIDGDTTGFGLLESTDVAHCNVREIHCADLMSLEIIT